MMDNKKLIIALIAVVVVILAGIVVLAPNTQNQNQTAYEIPLKTQAFSFFDMATPDGSNFTLKNNQSEVGRGMYYWQNTGKFANETDSIIISKNYTDRLIPSNMVLILENGTEKVYVHESVQGNYYKIVKTFNDTDIIVSGYNLPLMENMLNTTNVKDTSQLTVKEVVVETQKNDTAAENNTTVENKTVEKSAVVEKTEEKTPLETVIENVKEQTPEPKVEVTADKEPLMIGGGSFTTGSADEDRTYAKIYVGADHAGETVGTKIFYSRDGNALNKGNYVEATVDDAGFVSIASADAYAYYPDFAYVELYDSDGVLKSTQGIMLEKTSGTQYF